VKGELTAVIEATAEGGYWATCLEMSGANGQGETVQEAKADLLEAVRLILQDREEDVLRGLPSDAICEPLLIG
jgi:predicted RNase H-like HicB family nuclease